MKVKHLVILLIVIIGGIVGAFSYYFLDYSRTPFKTLPTYNANRELSDLTFLYSYGNNEGSELELKMPLNLALDASGNSYVVDNGDSQIKVYDAKGTYMYSIGSPGTEEGELLAPAGIAYHNGFVYVTEPTLGSIQAFEMNGTYSHTLVKESKENRYSPVGIKVTKDNTIMFTDVAGHRIIEINDKGEELFSFGRPGSGEGEFSYPHDLVLDSQERIYVADSNNGRIQVFERNGTYLFQIDGSLNENMNFALPRGIAIDSFNRLIVVDTLANQIRFFELNGEPMFEYGDRGSDDGLLNFPNGVIVEGNKIFIADRENNRIQVFSPAM
ncbi:MAG: 6-bladed beta-propeller [Anaerobacillus sp.]|uniref:6-bladed beta-propeller n=1 Tax=Anaerobacillus sp. TaxID=1872506 RepID=UPI00391DDFBA